MDVSAIGPWISENPKKTIALGLVAITAFVAYGILSSKNLIPSIKELKDVVALPLAPVIPFYYYLNR